MIDAAPVEYPDLTVPDQGRLAENITHFARALRKAGLPVGPARVIEAIRAVEAAGFTKRDDFFYTLQACFVSKPEQLIVFSQIFKLYWRDPQFLERMMKAFSPSLRADPPEEKKKAAEKRAAEALLDDPPPPPPDEDQPLEEELVIDAALSVSADEKLRQKDFEQMSLAEINDAKRAIAAIELPVKPIASRRTRADQRGRIADWRSTMRVAMRNGGELRAFSHKARRKQWPNLVVICDISGSMSGYSRMLLHFLHAASNAKGVGWAKVHAFAFGTRLTNITRALDRRDVDEALDIAGREATDWEGGTTIGRCLEDFNRDWSRRVLGQGAVVLLITDGLDRDDAGQLAKQAERLQLSCRKLIWLNPLLRWEGFEVKAAGMRALLPYVDSFRAVHNLASLHDLSAALNLAGDKGEKERLMRGVTVAETR